MIIVRLKCLAKPHKDEEWLLKRTRKGLAVVDEEDQTVFLIPAAEARLRVQIPIMVRLAYSLGFRGFTFRLTIEDDEEKDVGFFVPGKSIGKIHTLLDDCASNNPVATAAVYQKHALLYSLGGMVLFALGMSITIATLVYSKDDRFLVMTGLIIGGVLAFIRGIYLTIISIRYRRMANRDDGEDE